MKATLNLARTRDRHCVHGHFSYEFVNTVEIRLGQERQEKRSGCELQCLLNGFYFMMVIPSARVVVVVVVVVVGAVVSTVVVDVIVVVAASTRHRHRDDIWE